MTAGTGPVESQIMGTAPAKLPGGSVADFPVYIHSVVPPGVTAMSGGRLSKSFEELCDRAQEQVRRAATSFGNLLQTQVPIDEVELKLGVSFTSEGGIIIASATTEASLEITIKFKGRPVPGAKPE